MLEKKKTQRGFEFGEFEDTCGIHCSIQNSSSVEPKIWLGVDNVEPKIMAKDAIKLGIETSTNVGWIDYKIPKEVLLSSRMHLNIEQAKMLIEHLTNFVENGSI